MSFHEPIHNHVLSRLDNDQVTQNRVQAHSNYDEHSSIEDLQQLYRSQSAPMTRNHSVSDSPTKSRKPSFKIGLPSRNPLMLVNTVSKVIPSGLSGRECFSPSFTIVQDSSPHIFGSQFHLTPPPEDLSISPLETLLSRTEYTSDFPSADLLLSDVASMSSHEDPEAGVAEKQPAIDPADAETVVPIQRESKVDMAMTQPLDMDELATKIADHLAMSSISAVPLDAVHHPMPSPLPRSLAAEITSPALFSRLIGRVRSDERISATSVRISHIINPESSSPDNNPLSPMVTPSYLAQHGSGDYFAIKPEFSTIASPRGLVVPPGVAMLSVTERMIPASGEFEVHHYFNSATDSGFFERLNELAVGGLSVYIIPTKNGAFTFQRKYLLKLLQPILHNWIGLYSLRVHVAEEIANSAALKHLLSFEDMKTKIEDLLTDAKASSLNFPGASTPPVFDLVFSTRGTVQLPFKTWFIWWFEQERRRISGLLDYFLHTAKADPVQQVSRGMLMQELESEMRRRFEEQNQKDADKEGIELAVFVVKRSK